MRDGRIQDPGGRDAVPACAYCPDGGREPAAADRWPPERLAHLYLCLGLSTYEIAGHSGIDRQRVTRLLRRAGVPVRPRGPAASGRYAVMIRQACRSSYPLSSAISMSACASAPPAVTCPAHGSSALRPSRCRTHRGTRRPAAGCEARSDARRSSTVRCAAFAAARHIGQLAGPPGRRRKERGSQPAGPGYAAERRVRLAARQPACQASNGPVSHWPARAMRSLR